MKHEAATGLEDTVKEVSTHIKNDIASAASQIRTEIQSVGQQPVKIQLGDDPTVMQDLIAAIKGEAWGKELGQDTLRLIHKNRQPLVLIAMFMIVFVSFVKHRMSEYQRHCEVNLHKKKLEAERAHLQTIAAINRQNAFWRANPNHVQALKKYKKELMILPITVSLVLAYATVRTKSDRMLFEMVYYKNVPTRSSAPGAYSDQVKSIDPDVHLILTSAKYNPHTTDNDGGECMRKLRYKLIMHSLKAMVFQTNVHLQIQHIVFPSGHLRNTPGAVAHAIVKHRRFWEYLNDWPTNVYRKGKKAAHTMRRLLGKTVHRSRRGARWAA